MTTPEEVTGTWGQIPESDWHVHTWLSGIYTKGRVDTADQNRLVRVVIEALDKVRSKQKDGTVEEVIGVPAMGKFWAQDLEIYNRTGDTLRVTVQRSRPAPPLPDLQVGDRFTFGLNQYEVVYRHLNAPIFGCRIIGEAYTSLDAAVEDLVRRGATDFKRPVWEPVPTK